MDREELRRRMARHPNAVTLAEARRVLEAYGWTLVRISGSHYLFQHGSGRLVIPYRRPTILPIYVRSILKATEVEDGGA